MKQSFVQRVRPDNDDEPKCYGLEPLHANSIYSFQVITRDGNIDLVEYSQITGIKLKPSDTVLIVITIEEVITVKGRNLQELIPFFQTRRISFIQEDFSGIDDEEMSVFVESIEIKSKQHE